MFTNFAVHLYLRHRILWITFFIYQYMYLKVKTVATFISREITLPLQISHLCEKNLPVPNSHQFMQNPHVHALINGD